MVSYQTHLQHLLEYTLQELADVTEDELDSLGVHTIGTQRRVIKSTAKLKVKFGEKKVAKKILDPFASITNDTTASLFCTHFILLLTLLFSTSKISNIC
jgi:hypothetical protein